MKAVYKHFKLGCRDDFAFRSRERDLKETIFAYEDNVIVQRWIKYVCCIGGLVWVPAGVETAVIKF
jgi:hypothetical protein